MKIRRRWIILTLAVLCLVIIAPPIFYGYIYPTGGDDTAHHLATIAKITLSHPIPESYQAVVILSNCGEWLIGYPLVLMREFFHIPLTASFLWFNYLVLIGIALTSYFVFSKLCNQVTGLLASLVSFLFSTNVALFQAGAVYNITTMGIILPWALYFGIKRKCVLCGVLLCLFAVFHPTGRYLATLPIIGLVGWLLRKRLKSPTVAVLFVLGMLVMALLTVAYVFPSLSPDAGRQWVDAFAIMWLMLAVGLGWWLARLDVNMAVIGVVTLVLIGGYFRLPSWFSYTSAIKPFDKEIIAYVNTLPEKEFYGNQFVAPYVYEPYLKQTYEVGEGVYIWRSEPMTAGVTEGTHFYYWDGQPTTPPPIEVKSLKYFDVKGITGYVAEVTK